MQRYVTCGTCGGVDFTPVREVRLEPGVRVVRGAEWPTVASTVVYRCATCRVEHAPYVEDGVYAYTSKPGGG
jgi:hypothetical protein